MPKVVIASFKKAHVTRHSLPFLTEEIINKLIPSEGPSVQFQHHFSLFKESLSVETATNLEAQPLQSTSGQKRPAEAELETERKKVAVARDILSEDSPAINDLHQLLKKPPADGHVILAFYQNNNELSDRLRDKLVEKIIFHEIGSNYNKKIDKERFEQIADSVVELFPTKSKCLYFDLICQPVGTKGKLAKVVRGRLREKYYAVRRLFLKSGLISKNDLEIFLSSELEADDLQSVGGSVDGDDDEDDDFVWLRACDEPWVEVTVVWEATFTRRLKKRDQASSVSEYIALFPGLSTPYGAELLLRDAERIQQELSLNTIQWTKFLDNSLTLITKRKPSFKISDSATPNERSGTILTNLKHIFKVRTLPKPKGTKLPQWKPSKQEVGDAFLLHVKTISEIKGSLDARKRRLAKYGFKLQAVPVVVGDLADIRQSYVAVEGYRWDARDPLHAIEMAFKLSFALNTEYPPEAKHIWLFIQRQVYQTSLPTDFAGDPHMKSFMDPYFKEYDRLA